MTQSIPNNLIMLPSDIERRQIFYWLRKLSSVTAWRRIFSYYQAWATVAEQSLREADAQGWADKTAVPESHYVLILKGLAHCEEGVLRLAKGDKRVFKFDANGEFAMARSVLFHWAEMITRVAEGENVIDEQHTPLWLEFTQALTAVCQAWQECADQILEPRYLGEPAPTHYGPWLQQELKTMDFPLGPESVPAPVDNQFVRTNDYVPCSGIWEPVEAPPLAKSLLRSLFTRPDEPQAPFNIAGTINYLHGGSKSPQITVETGDDSQDIDTVWRLLWRDERYTNSPVPEYEAGYRFNYPKQAVDSPPAVSSSDEIIWGETGSVAPVSGKWLVESDIKASVVLVKGEKLPLHDGREVRWVLAERIRQ
ncbi:Immunity protein 72 [Duganella sp. CF402]|uniref:Imm71 family immunity protein n=1 Tax=unclassified Duganella TaxID=2636909 RepID=UPI0008D3492B|nr:MULTISPECIES: Imm71 family immunity protein [unclassified Duganella]RZT10023.1 immunity protein 72 of polymorphic toxin system [Duganella sp. BK701]SEL32194.1 Immunity protein 72 [Duganella sp. CF402]